MNMIRLALGLGLAATLASSAQAATVFLGFDDFDRGDAAIGDFYAGGSDSVEDVGISFSSEAFARCLFGPCGADGAERDNVLVFLDPPRQLAAGPNASLMNVSRGFDGTVALAYIAEGASKIRIWSGLNGTGQVLATFDIASTCRAKEACKATDFAQVSLDFAGLGHSIEFVGVNEMLFGVDVMKLNVGEAVPEPASWALMIAGFGLAGGALRRRRSQFA